jgi:hypothetical protein
VWLTSLNDFSSISLSLTLFHGISNFDLWYIQCTRTAAFSCSNLLYSVLFQKYFHLCQHIHRRH